MLTLRYQRHRLLIGPGVKNLGAYAGGQPPPPPPLDPKKRFLRGFWLLGGNPLPLDPKTFFGGACQRGWWCTMVPLLRVWKIDRNFLRKERKVWESPSRSSTSQAWRGIDHGMHAMLTPPPPLKKSCVRHALKEPTSDTIIPIFSVFCRKSFSRTINFVSIFLGGIMWWSTIRVKMANFWLKVFSFLSCSATGNEHEMYNLSYLGLISSLNL